jgi:glucose/mannose-6-phosphate isomerase
MKSLIENLPAQLREAQELFNARPMTAAARPIHNLIIAGLGGSGIGGTIVSELFGGESPVPIVAVKDYAMPAFLNENTLVIGSSYSGNTEETLIALEDATAKGATIAVVTSGGTLLERAQTHGWNHVVVPGGQPPRGMFAYGFVQLLNYLSHYGVVERDVPVEVEQLAQFLESEQADMRNAATDLAAYFFGRIPVLYAADGMGGVTWRFRQQLNENSKMLAWNAIVPEMNHNELVGWKSGTEQLAVLFLRNGDDHARNQARIEINKGIIEKYTSVRELWSKGSSRLEQMVYLIHLTDWVSYELAERNGVDILEIDAINYLKGELAKL